MTNPQFIGNSSNFNIQLLQTLTSSQCVGCIIAQVYSPLVATSTTAGNIITLSLTSSATSINQVNNLSIYAQLFAPIPVGGMFQILLPTTVTPTQPISCIDTYGFTLSSGSIPICGYNTSLNSIYTINLAYPNFVGSANALIQIQINNPPDTRNTYFSFQTYDSNARLIGNSSTPFLMNATPLQLSATATKTANQVQTSFKLTISLSIQVALTASNLVQIILPQANYNQTSIMCTSSGINLQCTNSLDAITGNLTLTMAPPCSQCTSGANMNLTVTGLTNPSFINNYTQNIMIQTATSFGIIELANIQLPLSPETLSISNYLRSGATNVGSNYTLSFNFVTPNYVIKNGGQIILNFTQFDTYINPIYSSLGQTYSYPQSINIYDSNNNSLQNSINYFSTSPNSVQQIIIQICNGISCPAYLTAYGLRRALTVVSGLTQNITITTQAGDQIASNSFTIMSNPIGLRKNLTMSLSNSVVTLNSNYIINFISNLLPFQSGLSMTLPSQSINGGCFVTHNSTILGYSFNCALLTTNTISITYSGDPTLMMIDNINYTLTITSVTNPPSTQPLLYSIFCSLNSVTNQQFTLTYAIQNPYPLTLSYSKNNNTLGQSAILTLTVTSPYPNFDQMSLSIPTGLLTVQSSSNYQSIVNNNSYFINGIYFLTNNSISINILNPTSTGITGNITFSMYVSNYSAAQGTVFINPVLPVFLFLAASVSSQVVGATSQLTVTFTRPTPFASQLSFNLNISPLLFNYASAQYNGSAVTFPLSVPIGVTSIIITNLKNLQYIPNYFNVQNALQGWTVDSSNYFVANNSYNVSNILPTTPVSGLSYSFLRNNTAINGIGSLVISYTPTYPSILGYMTINMPNQQTVIANPGCTIQTGVTNISNCIVTANNSTSITLKYMGQLSTTLTSVLNSQPNGNQLQVLMWTNNMELVQLSQGIVTPSIQYNLLIVTGSVTSSLVATPTAVQISVLSVNQIALNSKIVVNFPPNTFTTYNNAFSQDCVYTIQSMTYRGCQWSVYGGWVNQVNVSYLGPNSLPVNTTILITLPLANNWTSTPFLNNQVTIYLDNSQDYFISQGILSLAALYNGLSALTPAAIMGLTVSQTSLSAGSANIINLGFNLGVPVIQGSIINITMPKSSYSLNSSDPSLTNLSLTGNSQNSTFYTLSLRVPCTQSAPLCILSNTLYSISLKVSNNPYVKYQQDTPSIIVLTGSLPVTLSVSYTIPMYSPQQLTLSPSAISRSNKNAYQSTTAAISIPNPNISSIFTLAISPLLGTSPSLPLVNSISAVGNGQSTNYTFGVNSSNFINVLINGVSSTSQLAIIMNGINNLLVPINAEIYGLYILDGTYIYYYNNVTPNDTLVPYSSGVTLQRIITTVGSNTNIYMLGSLPLSFPPMSVSFNGNSFALSNQTFNLSLGTYINSNSITDNTPMPLIIKNTYYTAFSSSLPITPALTTQNLSAFLGLTIPNNMVISQSVSLGLLLAPTSSNYLALKLPPFFTTLTACCIDPSCTQSKITSCNFTITSDNFNLVQVILNGTQIVSMLTLTVTTVNYQIFFINSAINIYSAIPSSQIVYNYNISVSAAQISSSLSLANWRVNSLNNYTLTITPINRTGYLNITIPNYLSSQLTSPNTSSSYTLTINNIPISTSLTSNFQHNYSLIISLNSSIQSIIVLTITSVVNPINNQPFNFTLQQTQIINGVTQIYGSGLISVAMTQFDTITISSAIRNITKVGMPCSLNLVINTPNYSDSLIITFPTSQLSYIGPNCQVTLNSTQVVSCQYISNNSILTSNLPGTYDYKVTGFSNQLSFNANAQFDLVQASLGSPYTRALTQPASTTYITPPITAGNININSFTSTNTNLLQTTNLTYNFTLQNWNSINGIILEYGSYFYIIPPNVQCTVNGIAATCSSISANTILLNISNPTQQNIVVISNLLNYIAASSWTLKSVITATSNNITTYSDVDLYYNDGTTLQALMSSTLPNRLILPNNYVQSNITALIIIDTVLSQYVPLGNLQINLNSQGACTPTNFSFSRTLTLNCSFSQPTTLSISLTLSYTNFPSVVLSSGSSSLQIYPQPSNNCNNQMCDLCSSVNGEEYCFSCREGLVSSGGQCQSQCSGNSFPYAGTNICEPCSPSCATCSGLYSNNCLGCANSSQVLNSGTCQNSCPTGTYSYNNFCVTNDECDNANGCRICSNTDFCYQCLPDYQGQPTCTYSSSMPPTLMIYVLIPFLLIGTIPIFIVLFKCLGFDTLVSQTIFGFSTIQLFAWVVAVPIMPNIATSMVLLSLLVLRIIISIVSYQVFYKKNMGELSQLLLEQQSQKEMDKKSQSQNTDKSDLNNWKTKIVRFIAHFNGPDSYELLKSQISPPTLVVSHSTAVQLIFFINRVIVMILMIYMLTIANIGDSIYIPLISIVAGSIVSLCRLLSIDKVKACLSRLRS